MTALLITSLATAFALTVVEELLFSLRKWRGLFAFAVSMLGSYFTVQQDWGLIVFTALGSAFAGTAAAISILNLVESRDPRIVRGLPRRIPPL
ncbi:hypothetical protein UFOVP621_16 [uncultured Caudovirales phage]|uniref:Uncharacterized protein n=1 Tax=uncultured Caudovirales phage TaxID=2100421 RepID=A0A6J5N5E7_9CAUD|nr:hypothetical protein UFOVP621_16 [uncultured Caudovirales phage]